MLLHAYPKCTLPVHIDKEVEVAIQELDTLNIARGWGTFCMAILSLDRIETSKDEFVQLCIDMYTLDCDLELLVHTAVKHWHVDMNHAEATQAAEDCYKVFINIAKIAMTLGDQGAKTLSESIFRNDKFPLPETVEMVWNYIDWKCAVDCIGKKRRMRIFNPWNDFFTPENVILNKNIYCAVKIGIEVMKLAKK